MKKNAKSTRSTVQPVLGPRIEKRELTVEELDRVAGGRRRPGGAICY